MTSSSPDRTYSRPRHRRVIFPRDIRPELAILIISYARVIQRMPTSESEVAVRAMEATVSEWLDHARGAVQKAGDTGA